MNIPKLLLFSTIIFFSSFSFSKNTCMSVNVFEATKIELLTAHADCATAEGLSKSASLIVSLSFGSGAVKAAHIFGKGAMKYAKLNKRIYHEFLQDLWFVIRRKKSLGYMEQSGFLATGVSVINLHYILFSHMLLGGFHSLDSNNLMDNILFGIRDDVVNSMIFPPGAILGTYSFIVTTAENKLTVFFFEDETAYFASKDKFKSIKHVLSVKFGVDMKTFKDIVRDFPNKNHLNIPSWLRHNNRVN